MSVSAIIVTRGDVDLAPIWASLPGEWEKLCYDNGNGYVYRDDPSGRDLVSEGLPNLSVYGRYAAIQYASHDLIYVQDDDCIVSDPQAIVDAWWDDAEELRWREANPAKGLEGITDHLVANMPQEFRPHYPDSCLVGFGACFHRDLPDKAFGDYGMGRGQYSIGGIGTGLPVPFTPDEKEVFHRTCDVVFTTLTPRVLVDVPVEVLPYAHDANRMWKQPDHFGERTRVLEMARKVRDA